MSIIRSSRLYLCYCRMWCVMPWLRPGWGKLLKQFPHPGRIACCPAPNRRPLATKVLHTICGNNTSIVSSAWWWACKCQTHVEEIISAIKHSVASSWFSSLRIIVQTFGSLKPRTLSKLVWNLWFRTKCCWYTEVSFIVSWTAKYKVDARRLVCRLWGPA